jgi:hypothetical protein
MAGVSRRKKNVWATLAAQKIEYSGEKSGDIWKFVRNVHDFLVQRIEHRYADLGQRPEGSKS